MPHLEPETRARIADFFPRAISTALESYQNFTAETPLEEAGKFKAHHDACKVALAHIELLIKLAHWADIPDPKAEDENQQKILLSMIETAQSEVDGMG